MWMTTAFTVKPPPRPAAVQVVEDATLTVFGTGPMPWARPHPRSYIFGAVYDARGRLVGRSQRIGGWRNDHAATVDPPRLPPDDGAVVELSGTWLYGGTWFCHFGHFLTETLTTMWPQEDYDRVLCHPFWFGRDRLPYQLEALRLLGMPGKPAIVGRQRVRVERLLVPSRTFVPNAYALPEAREVWDRMRAGALRETSAPAHDKVFLSRAGYRAGETESRSQAVRRLPNDAQVDQIARDLGFEVVHPERLTLTEQIALASGAKVLAGPGGSALHLSVFMDPGAAVIELADGRARKTAGATQQVVCHLLQQRLGFVPLRRGEGGHDLGSMRTSLNALLADL